jgi:hypothetical protein
MHYRHSLAKDRGCTRPGCTVPGYGCQVHHAEKDWADGRLTNIDDLTLACPRDNRLVEEAAGAPENAKTAPPNGSHHHTSTPAKPGSTTTTTPSDTSSTRTATPPS